MERILASIENQISTAGSGTGAKTDVNSFVATALNVVFGFIGVIAVVMIVLGGISYATSRGDPGKIQKGKNTILYGIIGLVVVLMAFAIVNFVLKSV